MKALEKEYKDQIEVTIWVTDLYTYKTDEDCGHAWTCPVSPSHESPSSKTKVVN
jgi:hypothetical protein